VRGVAGRTLAATLLTLEDFVLEYRLVGFATDRPRAGGLRGGRWQGRGRGATLVGLSTVPGVTVSGRVADASRPFGRLRVRGSAAARGTVFVARDGRVSGRLGGRAVRGRFRVPPAVGEG
jgi:hypothetical protein